MGTALMFVPCFAILLGVAHLLLEQVFYDVQEGVVESEEDWFEYQLEHNPEFLRRVAEARDAIRAGKGIRLEDVLP